VDAVSQAFAAVPRAGFLPENDRGRAPYDGPIPIGRGQTNSQPRTVADMLRLLEVRPGQRILDVGAGSGWTTALLAHLTGPSGLVVGVELEPSLVSFGSDNLARAGVAGASIRQALPGVLGWPALSPYERILVSADGGEVPEALLAQLSDGGRMVLPAGGEMTLVVRTGDRVVTSGHGRYSFVPLR